MSTIYVNHFPIENFSLNNIQMTILILGLVEFISLIGPKKIYNFFSGFHQSSLRHVIRADDSNHQTETNDMDFTPRRILSRRDVDIVLRSLEMQLDSDDADFLECLDENDLFNLFEEKYPARDELKQAFDVFDGNRDGFIDAIELRKVLRALGLKEGLEMENCRRMIGVFDENGDGRIDFDEFCQIYGD